MKKPRKKKKMRAGRGKAKGSAFERLVCKALSLWFSNGKSSSLFWRSAMSGGRATVMQKAGKVNLSQQGDISAVDEAGHLLIKAFVIECKYYKNLKLDRSVVEGSGLLATFWRKVKKQARHCGKLPMLICKQNQMRPLVCLDTRGRFAVYEGRSIHHLVMRSGSADLWVFPLSTLLERPLKEVRASLKAGVWNECPP